MPSTVRNVTKVVVAAVALLAVAVWTGFSVAEGQAAGCGGQITTATNADAQGVSPLYGSDSGTIWRTDQISESLVTLDGKTLRPTPWLAESWTVSKDGTTYTFRVRRGPKWPDGTPLTAADFAFTLQAFLSPGYTGPWQGLFRDIVGADAMIAGSSSQLEGVKVLDPQTFSIQLAHPNAAFLATAAPYLRPIPEHLLKGQKLTPDNSFVQHPVGVGAYHLVEWVKGDHILLEANPGYWGKPVCASRLMDRSINDMNALALALESGDVDQIAPVSPRDLLRLKTNKNIKEYFPPAARMDALYFNFNVKPLADSRVRQAIAMTLNMKSFTQKVLAGLQAPVPGPLVAGSWANDPSIREPGEDLAKAKSLMAEAGYANGFTLTVGANAGNTTREEMASYVQAQVAKIGIKIDIQLQEWSTFITSTTQGKFQVVVLTTLAGIPDPDTLYADYHTNGASNYGKYSNPQLDRLLEDARAAQDVTQRKNLYKQAEQILVRDLPRVWAYEYLSAFATRANISNVAVSVVGDLQGEKWGARYWRKQ